MVRVRTVSVLTAVSLGLAGCGAPGEGPSPAATPRFVAPSSAGVSPAPPVPSSAPPTAASASATSASPKPKASSSAATRVTYVFPVKASNVDYHPTHSKYPGTDIFADCGEPVVATTSGVILEVGLTDRYVKGRPDGPYNGGLFVSLLGDDGVRYYGSHLSEVRSGIRAGVRVEAGRRLGDVGRTGNANNVCHLHYGISPPCAGTGDWKVRRGVVWPAPYLDSWREKGGRSPVAAVRAWNRTHDCRA